MAALKQPAVEHQKSEKPTRSPANKKRAALVGGTKRAANVFDNESEVITRAIDVIGDRNDAMRWMGTPVRALDYSTPVALLGTKKGRQAVIAALGRLEHGVL